MGICAEEMRRHIIAPCLHHLGDWSQAAENLLLGTAAIESGLGRHLLNNTHTGLGVYQIPPERHDRIWDEYLVHSPDLASKVRGLASQRNFLEQPHAELTTNLSYATAVAWMIYKSNNEVLPSAQDLAKLASLWCRDFSMTSKNQPELFMREYERCQSNSVKAA